MCPSDMWWKLATVFLTPSLICLVLLPFPSPFIFFRHPLNYLFDLGVKPLIAPLIPLNPSTSFFLVSPQLLVWSLPFGHQSAGDHHSKPHQVTKVTKVTKVTQSAASHHLVSITGNPVCVAKDLQLHVCLHQTTGDTEEERLVVVRKWDDTSKATTAADEINVPNRQKMFIPKCSFHFLTIQLWWGINVCYWCWTWKRKNRWRNSRDGHRLQRRSSKSGVWFKRGTRPCSTSALLSWWLKGRGGGSAVSGNTTLPSQAWLL